MKNLLVLLSALFICAVAIADTETISWLVDGDTYTTTTCQTGGDITLPTAPTKYGYTFQGWRDYIPLEYIESPGCAYIQTDYNPNQDTRIKTKFIFTGMENGHGYIFGGAESHNIRVFELFVWSNQLITSYVNQVRTTNSPRINVGDTVVVDWNKNAINWSLNSVQQDQITMGQGTFTSPIPARIFALSRSTGSCGNTKAKMYYFQIYDNGVLVHDFIPVLGAIGKAGLYDKVEGKTYYSEISEDFIAGPRLNE